MTEVVFRRASTKEGVACEPFFYMVALSPGFDGPEHIVEHVRLNPGTIRVETLLGEQLWPPSPQLVGTDDAVH